MLLVGEAVRSRKAGGGAVIGGGVSTVKILSRVSVFVKSSSASAKRNSRLTGVASSSRGVRFTGVGTNGWEISSSAASTSRRRVNNCLIAMSSSDALRRSLRSSF